MDEGVPAVCFPLVFAFPFDVSQATPEALREGWSAAAGVHGLTLGRICSLWVAHGSSLCLPLLLASLPPSHDFFLEQSWTFWKVGVFVHINPFCSSKLSSVQLGCF